MFFQNIIIIIISCVVGIGLLITILFFINVLLIGFTSYHGESADSILGCPTLSATASDLDKLSIFQTKQLFHALDAPAFKDMNGEYDATIFSVGPIHWLMRFYLNTFFGPGGKWIGKAFKSRKDNSIEGYNIFSVSRGSNESLTKRARKMSPCFKKSRLDSKTSLYIGYSIKDNPFIAAHTVCDEIRKINNNLYLGMGYMPIKGFHICLLPFFLRGPGKEYIGLDS
jgi:hypothetical protein